MDESPTAALQNPWTAFPTRWTILRGCFFASNKESCSDRERHRGRYKYTLQEVLQAELRQRMTEVLQQR
jgi:hypothetical protein